MEPHPFPLSLRTGGRGEAVRFVRGLFVKLIKNTRADFLVCPLFKTQGQGEVRFVRGLFRNKVAYLKTQTFGLPFYCFLDKLQLEPHPFPLSLRTGGRGEAVRFVRGLFVKLQLI